MAKLLEEYL